MGMADKADHGYHFRRLKRNPYWVNHFCFKSYCVDTVGVDADMIRKYVRYQESKLSPVDAVQKAMVRPMTCAGDSYVRSVH